MGVVRKEALKREIERDKEREKKRDRERDRQTERERETDSQTKRPWSKASCLCHVSINRAAITGKPVSPHCEYSNGEKFFRDFYSDCDYARSESPFTP